MEKFLGFRKDLYKGNMSVQAKTKMFNMCVIPVLTYGTQT
mgnify:CR=1 FL=1